PVSVAGIFLDYFLDQGLFMGQECFVTGYGFLKDAASIDLYRPTGFRSAAKGQGKEQYRIKKRSHGFGWSLWEGSKDAKKVVVASVETSLLPPEALVCPRP